MSINRSNLILTINIAKIRINLVRLKKNLFLSNKIA